MVTGWAGEDCKTRDLRPCTKGCAAGAVLFNLEGLLEDSQTVRCALL